MKEELIRVLKAKLDDTNANINSLVELNEKIDAEKEKLDYAKKILGLFKSDDGYNILNFVKLERNDFDKVLKIIANDDEKIFESESCNYDGLIYLINGINNGVSLTLTDEQKNGIEYLIKGLNKKSEEYSSTIEGLGLVKERFAVSNLDVLNGDKARYEKLLSNIDNEKYVDDTDALKEAIEFNKIENNRTIELLSYVLKYNADLYKNNVNNVREPIINNLENENVDLPKMGEEHLVNDKQNAVNEEFHFHEYNNFDLEKEDLPKEEISLEEPRNIVNENNEITFENKEVSNTSVSEPFTGIEVEMPTVDVPFTNIPNEVSLFNEKEHEDNPNQSILDEQSDEVEKTDLDVEIPKFEEINPSNVLNEEHVETNFPEINIPEVPENVQDNNEMQVESNIDSDFSDVVTHEDYEEENVLNDVMSTRELQRLFVEYNVQTDKLNFNELLVGNIDNYKMILETLKQNKLIEEFEKNTVLFTEMLLGSGKEEIENVLRIIKDELSVDKDDYEITLKIALNTIPTIFIKDGGNYDNFVRNVEFFKQLDVNLINLFDFSKEVLIANNTKLINNYDIVKQYNVKVDYNNAKYLLLLPNIAERMDYYVESIYQDKTKNEVFDGINYINNYAVKLNSVTDLTIKRLRYASENGNKIFGSKPYSLSGEITNLKVNAIELGDMYLNNFFNNNFDGLSSDEVREYVKLTRNTSNVGNYSDELDMLEKYHQGLRYVINNVNVSYNKVVRNYNTLRSYGINRDKALHFAVCYNLVITKDEYQMLKNILGLGGNA